MRARFHTTSMSMFEGNIGPLGILLDDTVRERPGKRPLNRASLVGAGDCARETLLFAEVFREVLDREC